MRRKKVLIVDDEESIVLALLRSLYRDNERYDVMPASTGEIAQRILTENEIDVMVADVRMPGMSGLDLLCWAAAESPKTRVIVMTAFDIEGLREQAFRFGCLQITQKPFDLHEMRALVLDALDHRDSVVGSLSDLSPADVIQMLCLSRKTTALRVVHRGSYGMVHVEHGEIVHATWDDESGETAFYRVLAAGGGMFNTLPLPAGAPRTIEVGWQHLLIEGMRLADEAATRELVAPPPRDGKGADPSAARAAKGSPRSRIDWDAAVQRERRSPGRETEVAHLIDDGFARLRAGEPDEARRLWESALQLDPGNRMIELNLRKLDAMGQADS